MDLAGRALRRDGETIKIQELPLRMLVLLVARPGQVVTREELQKHLWPDGTFVEFEHGLNTAVKKLRQALGDDAETPSFIETVPRQGYRFVGTIEPVQPTRQTWQTRSIIAAAILALAVFGLWALLHTSPEPAATEAFIRDLRRLTADSGLSSEPAISPDGELVAYSSDRGTDGNLDIWIVHARGGDPIRLTDDPADDREPHFCPDGRVVFRSDRDGGGVYIVPSLGGRAVLLAPQGRRPQCSPDGKRVAFWVGQERSFTASAVFSIPAAGGPSTRVARDLLNAMRPIWSPDGKYLLVYGHERTKRLFFEADWWLTPADGGNSIALRMRELLGSRLNVGHGVPLFVNWDVRTGDVLFSAAERSADPFALWHSNFWSIHVSTVSKAARELRQLTTGSAHHRDASTTFNRAFVFSDLELNPDIWSIAIDHATGTTSGAMQPVMTDLNWQSRPTVSRNGAYMAYRTERESGWEFWLKNLSSGDESPITVSGGIKVWCVLNRDGSQIAYHSSGAVHVADTKTGATRVLCGDCQLRVADWTPAGNAVLVLDEAENSFALLNVSDGSLNRILRQSSGGNRSMARISPDGRWLAYWDDELRIARFDGNRPIAGSEWKLAGFEVDEWLEWSPDGNLIYFLSYRDGPLCLWAVRAHNTAPPFPVLHFHQRRRALLGGFSVAPDRLYLGLHETTGNIWTGMLRE